LRAHGEVSPGFKWPTGSPFEGRSAQSVLEDEGIEFDSKGLASKPQRLRANELKVRIGEEFDFEDIISESVSEEDL
jgi:hypothetical protein